MSGQDSPQNPEFVASAIKAKPTSEASQRGTAAAAAPAKKKQKKTNAKRK